MRRVYDFIGMPFNQLIFPIERPVDTTYFSSFYIEAAAFLAYENFYEFHAVQSQQLETHTLERIGSDLFVVHHQQYGDIFFSTDNRRSYSNREYEYVGGSSEDLGDRKFIHLSPKDNDQLNFLCEFHSFFFVGYVDRFIEHRYESPFEHRPV